LISLKLLSFGGFFLEIRNNPLTGILVGFRYCKYIVIYYAE